MAYPAIAFNLHTRSERLRKEPRGERLRKVMPGAVQR